MFIDILTQGIWDLPIWGMIVFALISCHITLVSITLFLHRAMAHRAIDLHPALSHFMRFWLWLTTGMRTDEWVAVHRKHHTFCERTEDPHSPIKEGIWQILFGGALFYRKETANAETLAKYASDMPSDWVEHNIYRPFCSLGIVILAVIDVLLFGYWGMLIYAAQMINTPLLAAGVVNGIGHYWGYRNYDTDDASRNIVPLGVVICGEELHNNHHAYPTSAKFSLRPWEIDVGWFYVQLFSKLGLASVRRIAPLALRWDATKSQIDGSTLDLMRHGRMELLREYTEKVLKPFSKQLRHRHGLQEWQLLKDAMKRLENPEDNSDLDLSGMKEHDQVSFLLEFRAYLRDFRVLRNLSTKKMLELIENWAERAQKSGIDNLSEFARCLPGYFLQKRSASSPLASGSSAV